MCESAMTSAVICFLRCFWSDQFRWKLASLRASSVAFVSAVLTVNGQIICGHSFLVIQSCFVASQ